MLDPYIRTALVLADAGPPVEEERREARRSARPTVDRSTAAIDLGPPGVLSIERKPTEGA